LRSERRHDAADGGCTDPAKLLLGEAEKGRLGASVMRARHAALKKE